MKREPSNRTLKIGELARRTRLSVRTLHYYEEIGLLAPSHRTASGHRQYSPEDIVRLQQIKSLRALGFTLDEVRECLRNPHYSPLRVMEDHLARAREQLALQQQLVDRLTRLVGLVRRGGEIHTEEFLKTLEVMSMWQDKLTPEQRAEVKERASQLGTEKVHAIEREWVQLIADLRAEMQRGTDPKSERVQKLLKRSRELVRVFSGGNLGIEVTLSEAYRSGAGAAFGLDAELQAYFSRAAH